VPTPDNLEEVMNKHLSTYLDNVESANLISCLPQVCQPEGGLGRRREVEERDLVAGREEGGKEKEKEREGERSRRGSHQGL
jgi:hypothetical protein